jgi:hypothetical protein
MMLSDPIQEKVPNRKACMAWCCMAPHDPDAAGACSGCMQWPASSHSRRRQQVRAASAIARAGLVCRRPRPRAAAQRGDDAATSTDGVAGVCLGGGDAGTGSDEQTARTGLTRAAASRLTPRPKAWPQLDDVVCQAELPVKRRVCFRLGHSPARLPRPGPGSHCRLRRPAARPARSGPGLSALRLGPGLALRRRTERPTS